MSLVIALVGSTLLCGGAAQAGPLRERALGLFGTRSDGPKLTAIKAAYADKGLRDVMRATGKQITLAKYGGWWWCGGIVLTGRGVERWNRNFGIGTGAYQTEKMALSWRDRIWTQADRLQEAEIGISPEHLAADIAAIKATPAVRPTTSR